MVFLFFSFYISSKEGEGRREDKTPGLIFGSFSKLGPCFSIVFAFASVVEAAPQARPKTTAVANTALGPSPWRALDFGEKGKEKRSEIKRKEKTKTREEGKAEQSRAERRKEKTKTREERRAEQSRKKKRGKEEKRREEKSVIIWGAFASPGLPEGSLCYFLWCLWLVSAVCGLGDRSGPVFWFIFEACSMFFNCFFIC